jgi:hypothetical protein
MRHIVSASDGEARFHRGLDSVFGSPRLYADLFLDRIIDEGGGSDMPVVPSAAKLGYR